jgi:nucleoside-diphosphate-sugar epimerase
VKVCVLGGDGFVGSAFIRFCAKQEIDCDCIDLDNYDVFKGSDYDILINTAGNSKKYLSNERPVEDFRFSLEALLRSFFDFSFRKYIYISSIDVYPDHEDPACNREDSVMDIGKISHYGFHKYMGEKMVEHYLSDWLIIRLGGVLGPGLKKNPVFDLINDIPLRVHEDSEYQYLSTDSLAELVFGLIEQGSWGEVFNICGEGTVTLREIRSWLKKSSGYHSDNVSRERYEVSNEKIKQLFDMPDSREVAREFVLAPDLPD